MPDIHGDMANDIFDELDAPAKTDPFDEAERELKSSGITLSPYQKYRLSGGERVSGPFGPDNPSEVAALPQVLNIPAAIIEKTQIPQALEEVGSDLLRRTGINPSAQPGEPLAPKREDEAFIPSPLEQAFPKATRGAEEAFRQFTTPGQVLAAPFVGLKPVQAAFEAQMAAGLPGSVEETISYKTPEERTKAIDRKSVV